MILSQLPKLHSKTRGIIEADVTRVLDPLRREKLADHFGTTTNLSPDDILNHGRAVVVDTRQAG